MLPHAQFEAGSRKKEDWISISVASEKSREYVAPIDQRGWVMREKRESCRRRKRKRCGLMCPQADQ